ncbi:hypothetical protein C1H46_040725 [Malus baccata]|uniref:Uncharacterized protein n=1 Tax=Malus baccata TaxID=106549 RepID=A0A540KHU0_MALBA|nr:hypothetical protein C1H46_040725 [Malus baccata]
MAASSLGQGETAMEDVGRSSRQDQITGEGKGEIAIAMEDVSQSSRQDDQITGEGAHENTAGDTKAGDTRMDPILYRYATMSNSGVIYLCQEFIRDMRTRYFAGATGIPHQIELLVRSSENKVSTRGNTMLHLAANTGHVQLIELITRTFPGLVRKRNHVGELPLHVAASAGHLSAVRKLVACTEGGKAFFCITNYSINNFHFFFLLYRLFN